MHAVTHGKRSPLVLFTALIAMLATVALIASPAMAAGKTKSVHVSGKIVLDPADNSTGKTSKEGKLTVTPGDAMVSFVGSLAGTAHEPYFAVGMTDKTTLQYSTHAKFTGKFMGKQGTLSYFFAGDAEYGGLITFTKGTGGLAGITGRILYYPISATEDLVTFGYEGSMQVPK